MALDWMLAGYLGFSLHICFHFLFTITFSTFIFYVISYHNIFFIYIVTTFNKNMLYKQLNPSKFTHRLIFAQRSMLAIQLSVWLQQMINL